MKIVKERPTSGDVPGRQEKYCWYLHWAYLSKACLNVGLRLDAVEAVTRSADRWGFFSPSRSALHGYVRQEWCRLTGEPIDHFPYSEDGVVQMFMRVRKRNPKEVEEITQNTDTGLVEAAWLKARYGPAQEPETPFDLPLLPEE